MLRHSKESIKFHIRKIIVTKSLAWYYFNYENYSNLSSKTSKRGELDEFQTTNIGWKIILRASQEKKKKQVFNRFYSIRVDLITRVPNYGTVFQNRAKQAFETLQVTQHTLLTIWCFTMSTYVGSSSEKLCSSSRWARRVQQIMEQYDRSYTVLDMVHSESQVSKTVRLKMYTFFIHS